MHLTVLTLFATCMLGHAAASRNITVDDFSGSPNLTYNLDIANWKRWGQGGHEFYQADATFSYNGTLLTCDDPKARAVFKFSGTAIYFLTPLWPRRANVVLSLDGEDPPTTVDLQDYSLPNGIGVEHPSKASDIRWSRTDLPDGEHTLVITRGTSAFVDALMYTTQTEAQAPVASESTKTADSTSALAAPASASTNPAETALTSGSTITPAMIGGIVGGAISALLLVGIALFLVWRHKSRPMLTPPKPTNLMVEIPQYNQHLTTPVTPFTSYDSFPPETAKIKGARPASASEWGSVVNIGGLDVPPSYH